MGIVRGGHFTGTANSVTALKRGLKTVIVIVVIVVLSAACKTSWKIAVNIDKLCT